MAAFRRNVLPPCSGLKLYIHFIGLKSYDPTKLIKKRVTCGNTHYYLVQKLSVAYCRV
jgi:hypothetical protein